MEKTEIESAAEEAGENEEQTGFRMPARSSQ